MIFIGCHFHWAFRTFHRASLTPRLLSPTSLVDKWRFITFRQPRPQGFTKISTARIASWVIIDLKEETTSCQLYLELHKKNQRPYPKGIREGFVTRVSHLRALPGAEGEKHWEPG